MAEATLTLAHHWPYFTLRNGRLYDERERLAYLNAPLFANVAEAEAWLAANDLRGNVRGAA